MKRKTETPIDDLKIDFSLSEFKALIIDPHFKSSDKLRKCLVNLSTVVRIASANTIESATHYLQDDLFSVLFIDMDIKNKDDLKTLEELRKHARKAPIIIITELIHDIKQVELKKAGISSLLTTGDISPNTIRRTLDDVGVKY